MQYFLFQDQITLLQIERFLKDYSGIHSLEQLLLLLVSDFLQ
jgi:hypothetical protein